MSVKWLANVRIFAAWLVGFGLTLVIVLLWHELVMVFVVNTLHWDRYAVPLIHILYYCGAGLLWVGFFIAHMEYINRSAREGRLLEASWLTIGPELIFVALGQAGLMLYGFFPADALGFLLIACEGAAGAGMLILVRRMRQEKHSEGGRRING